MKCKGKTQNGTPCQGFVRTGSLYCYFHDPALSKQRHESQRKGGLNRSRFENLPDPPCDVNLEDPHNIPKLLTYIAKCVLRGQMDTKVAYAFGYLSDCALRAHNAGDLADRVAEIERLQRVEQASPVQLPDDYDFIQFEEEDQSPGPDTRGNDGNDGNSEQPARDQTQAADQTPR